MTDYVKWLRWYMETNQLSQAKMARQLDISDATLGNWLKGNSPHVNKFADALDNIGLELKICKKK